MNTNEIRLKNYCPYFFKTTEAIPGCHTPKILYSNSRQP